MAMIAVFGPLAAVRARRYAECVVTIGQEIGILRDPETRPEPGTVDDQTFAARRHGLNCRVVTEYRASDRTRHVMVHDLFSSEPLIDVVFADSGNEELEQALVNWDWLDKLNACDGRPPEVDPSGPSEF